MLTSDDPNPPHICNVPIDNLISLYYVLWIILVWIDFSLHLLKYSADFRFARYFLAGSLF